MEPSYLEEGALDALRGGSSGSRGVTTSPATVERAAAHDVEGGSIVVQGIPYTDQERDEMRGLPSAEALVLHALKSEFEGELGPGGAGEPGTPGTTHAVVVPNGYTPAPCFSIVCTQRPPETVIEAIEDFIEAQRMLPYDVSWVLGDTSLGELRAAQYLQDRELPVEVIPKAPKGEWDEGSEIRDERVVAKASAVYAFDSSARSRRYEMLCKRQRKPFHTL